MTDINKIPEVSSRITVPEGHSVHHSFCPHDCPDSCSMLVTRNDKTGKAVRVQEIGRASCRERV